MSIKPHKTLLTVLNCRWASPNPNAQLWPLDQTLSRPIAAVGSSLHKRLVRDPLEHAASCTPISDMYDHTVLWRGITHYAKKAYSHDVIGSEKRKIVTGIHDGPRKTHHVCVPIWPPPHLTMTLEIKTRRWKFVLGHPWLGKKAVTVSELHPSQVYCIVVTAIINLRRQFYTKKFTTCTLYSFRRLCIHVRWVHFRLRWWSGSSYRETNWSPVWHTFLLYLSQVIMFPCVAVRGGRLCGRRVSDACAHIDQRASVNLSFFHLGMGKETLPLCFAFI
jgi:hypothetical protein